MKAWEFLGPPSGRRLSLPESPFVTPDEIGANLSNAMGDW
jgi:hypothetical protein